MSGTTAPGAVAVAERQSRWILLVPLAASGFMEVGLVAGLLGAVRDGGFSTDRGPMGPVGNAIVFVLIVPVTLLLGLALVAMVLAMVRPTRTTVLTNEEYRREVRGKVVLRIHRDQVTGLVFRPGGQTTWQGSDPEDPTLRGVGRGRLHNRIELRSPAATVELYDGKHWAPTVDLLRDWVRARPELVDDPVSIAFLRDAAASPGSSLPMTHETPGGPSTGPAPRRLPGTPFGLIPLAIRRRDPWAPFLPDAYGRYSSLFSGRYSLPRAPRRGSTLGLIMRWVFLVLWLAPFCFPLYLAGRIAWLVLS